MRWSSRWKHGDVEIRLKVKESCVDGDDGWKESRRDGYVMAACREMCAGYTLYIEGKGRETKGC